VADIRDVAVSPDGTIVVTGGTVDRLFVAKYSSAGDLIWIWREYIPFEQPFGLKVVIDSEGQITVIGARYPHDNDNADIALIALSPDGGQRWSTLLEGADGPYGGSIALFPNGDLLVVGTTLAPVYYGGGQVLLPTSREQTFLSRWSNVGSHIETRILGPAAPYVSFQPDVRVDGAGRIVVQETERDDTGANAVGPQMVLRVLDEQMTPQWDLPIGNGYQPHTLALSASSIVASRWTDDPFNADNPTSVGGNMEVLGLDMLGHAAMSAFGDRTMGAPVTTFVSATAVGSVGEIAHTGAFAGTVDFGSGPLTSTAMDETDAFVVLTEPPAL
jgi:hypothetical protein